MKTQLLTAALLLISAQIQAGYNFDNSSNVTVSKVSVFNEQVTGNTVTFRWEEDTHNTVSGAHWNNIEWGKINCKTHIYQNGGYDEQPDWEKYDSQDIVTKTYQKIENYVCGLTDGVKKRILTQEEINQLQKFMTDHCIDNVTWFIASYTRMTLTLNYRALFNHFINSRSRYIEMFCY